MRVYVAGPMTGLPNCNYDAFHAASDCLRAVGHEVENPAENENPGGKWSDWLRLGIAQVIRSDGIATLGGWESSRGARLEVHVGNELGITIAPLHDWILRAALETQAT